jgi:hypothetical protein
VRAGDKGGGRPGFDHGPRGQGDTVSVTYRNVGNAMNASQVRITIKAH